ncbi:hypothetical protein EV421DRAFT_1666825, partial [Armillaria borealis]
YNLYGIIYYGGEHFTARYIDRQQTVWFNDGVRTGHSSIKEGDIHQMDQSLLANKGKYIVQVIVH